MPTQTRKIRDTVTHALTTTQRKRRLKLLGWLVIAATCMACFPPPMQDGAEVETGDTSGDGDGDGDGSETGLPDMGDGDGDGEPSSPCNFPLDPCPNNDCGVDGRRNLSDMDCGVDGCLGLWSGTDVWAPMIEASLLANLPFVEPTTVWDCDVEPDVDACVEVDANGHIGCFRVDGQFAIPVLPSCAVAGEFAVDAGNGMCAADDASCLIPPVVTCTTEGECWASTPLWTAEAAVATAEMISTAEEQGLWLPSDLDVGDECWTLVGTDRHACTVGVCGQRLFGRPASELPLEPNTECDFIGAWPSTGWAFDTCFGIVEGVAVELRAI